VPVIINKGIGDTEDLVVSNRAGVVIEGFDPASYAGALKELLKLIREDRGLSGRCAKAAVDNLSLGLGADRYNLIYERMFSCTW